MTDPSARKKAVEAVSQRLWDLLNEAPELYGWINPQYPDMQDDDPRWKAYSDEWHQLSEDVINDLRQQHEEFKKVEISPNFTVTYDLT